MLEKIKVLVTVLASSFGIAFLDGLFGWDLDEGFYILIGGIIFVCLIWLLFLVYKKQ